MEARGEGIKGSRFLRDFCARCDEPMRVSDCNGNNLCEECRPHPLLFHKANLTPRQRHKLNKTDGG